MSSLLWSPTQLYLREGGREAKNEALLFQSTIGIHIRNARNYSSLQLTYTFDTLEIIPVYNWHTHSTSSTKLRRLALCAFSEKRCSELGAARGGSRNLFWGGAKPRSPIEGYGRSPNRGREAPEYRGRSPSRGHEAPENWGRSPNRGRSPRKIGGRGLGRGLGEPLPRKFWKIKLETNHFGAYLKQLFEMTNKMV